MTSSASRYRRGILGILAFYWIVIFAGTHLTLGVPDELEIEVSDKLKHYVAYAGLAFLLASYRAFRSPPTFKSLFWLFGLVAAYGVFDELSQIPVGRDAELADWFADLIGAVTGLAVFSALGATVQKRRRVD